MFTTSRAPELGVLLACSLQKVCGGLIMCALRQRTRWERMTTFHVSFSSLIKQLMRPIDALQLLLLGVQHRRSDTGPLGLVSETAGDRNARAALMFQLIVASGQLTLSGLGTAPLCLGMN